MKPSNETQICFSYFLAQTPGSGDFLIEGLFKTSAPTQRKTEKKIPGGLHKKQTHPAEHEIEY